MSCVNTYCLPHTSPTTAITYFHTNRATTIQKVFTGTGIHAERVGRHWRFGGERNKVRGRVGLEGEVERKGERESCCGKKVRGGVVG